MEKKKKKRVISVFVILVFLVGLSLLLYPAIADYVNFLDAHKVINEYNEQIDSLDEDANAEILAAAREYNAALAVNTPYIAALTDDKRTVYNDLLNVTGSGIMGYVDIPEINVFLPIYHGADNGILSMGAGHFEGSSLPVGGESVHTVLTSHSGLATAKLFTDLDKMKLGDTFSIHVLDETLIYEVDKIEIMEPDGLYGLHIDKGMDYCSLVTCTPYGINTHRLVVRGRRMEPDKETVLIEMDSGTHKNTGWHMELLYVPIVVTFILIVIVLISQIKKRRH